MLDVEVLGLRARAAASQAHGAGMRADTVRELCRLAAGARGVADGHLTVHFIDPRAMAELNGRHRGRLAPTDVLSFPIDFAAVAGSPEGLPAAAHPQPAPAARPEPPAAARPEPPAAGPPLELGDVFVCAAHTDDLAEAIVHGVLHLTGMDHERDDGEMLALQARLLASLARGPARSHGREPAG